MHVYLYIYTHILHLAEPSVFEHIQYTTVIFLKKKGAHLPKSFFMRFMLGSRATPLSKTKALPTTAKPQCYI